MQKRKKVLENGKQKGVWSQSRCPLIRTERKAMLLFKPKAKVKPLSAVKRREKQILTELLPHSVVSLNKALVDGLQHQVVIISPESFLPHDVVHQVFLKIKQFNIVSSTKCSSGGISHNCK